MLNQLKLTKELRFTDFTNICKLRKTLQESTSIIATLQGANFKPRLTRSDSSYRWIELCRRSEEIKFEQKRRIVQMKFLFLKIVKCQKVKFTKPVLSISFF
jgi:hypothetical protein